MWKFLKQMVQLVLRNLGVALRITIGPMVFLSIVTQVTVWMMFGGLFDGGSFLLLSLLSAFVLSWVAVAWHRYILREEAPTGLFPALNGAETVLHVGWSFLLGLGGALLAWALEPQLTTVLMPFAGSSATGDWLASLGPSTILLLLVSYLALRLGLVLPAAALGHPMNVFESWDATRPAAWPILGLAGLGVLGLGLTGIVAPVLFEAMMGGFLHDLVAQSDLLMWAVVGASIALNWLAMMLALSVLTTLYGHLVERRPLSRRA